MNMVTVKVTVVESANAYNNDFIDQRTSTINPVTQQQKLNLLPENRHTVPSLSGIRGATKFLRLSIGVVLLLFFELQYISATKGFGHKIEDFDDYNFDYDSTNDDIFNDDDESATLMTLSKYLYGTDVIELFIDDDTVFYPVDPMKSKQQQQRKLKFDKPPPPPPNSGGAGQTTDDNFHTADDDFSILDVIRPRASPTISPTVQLSSSEPSLVFWSVNPTLLPTFIIVDPTDEPTPTFHPSTTIPSSNTTDDWNITTTKAPVKQRPTRKPARKPTRRPARKPSRRPSSKPRTSRPTSSRQPTKPPRSVEPSDRPIRPPTPYPSREPTRPTPFPSMIVLRNETNPTSNNPNVQSVPTVPPSKSIEQTVLPLADFTIRLRIPLGTPMINVTSIGTVLEDYFEIEMVYTNLQAIHLHLHGASSDVVTSGAENDGVDDSIVTDIVYHNSEARFVGNFKPKLAGLLDEQEFLLQNTDLIQQYIDTSILTSGAKIMGNSNITVVQCFLDGEGDNSTTSTSQSESVGSGNNPAPDTNSTMENFLQSPFGFWTILVVSGAIATLLIILGIVIIKRTKDEYKCTMDDKKDEGNEDDKCSLAEMYITVPKQFETNGVLEDTESESDFGNVDTSTNKNQKKIAQQFHSLLTLSKTGSSSQFDTTNKASFDDDDDINYAFSFDVDEQQRGGTPSSTTSKHLLSPQVLSIKMRQLETIDDINATPSTTTIEDDDNDNDLSPKRSPDNENIRDLMIKMKFLDPSSNVVINGENDGESEPQSPANSSAISVAPKPYSSSAAYFRQQQQPTSSSKYKSSSQQKKQQNLQQKNLYSHRLGDYDDDDDDEDDFNDYGRTVHRQWRQDASVSELSHDENDFDYNDDGYSTGDIMTMSGTI